MGSRAAADVSRHVSNFASSRKQELADFTPWRSLLRLEAQMPSHISEKNLWISITVSILLKKISTSFNKSMTLIPIRHSYVREHIAFSKTKGL